MFWSKPTLGMALFPSVEEPNGTTLRCTIATRRRGAITVLWKNEWNVPSGICEQGWIRDPEAMASGLQSILPKGGEFSLPKHIRMCLPAQRVYATVISVPDEGRKKREASLRGLIAESIPESIDEIAWSVEELQSPGSAPLSGVHAVRSEILEGCRLFCDALQFACGGIAAPAQYIGEFMGATGGIVLLAVYSREFALASVLRDGVMVDEIVFDPGSEEKDFLQGISELLADDEVGSISVCTRSASLLKMVQGMGKGKYEVISVPEDAIITDEDIAFLPAVAASLASDRPVMNLHSARLLAEGV